MASDLPLADAQQLRAVLAAAGASGAWDWDIAADRLTVDDRFAELYGLGEGAAGQPLPTRTFYQAIHPDDRVRIRIAVTGLLSGAELFSKEFRVVTPDGATLWMHGRGLSHLNSDDEPVRFTGLLVDVTERKRTEERLRIAQSAGGVGTFEYQDGFSTVSVSSEFCRLLGLHPTDRLPVRTINAVLYDGEAPLIPEGDAPNIPENLDGEFRIRHADADEPRWIARRGEIIRESDGKGFRLLGAIYDVTWSKAQEVELRRLNENLEQRIIEELAQKKIYADLVETSPASVTVLDTDYRVLAINVANAKALYTVFGRMIKVGENFLDLFEGTPALAQQRKIWSRVLAGESYSIIEEFGDDAREKRFYEVWFSPILDTEGRIIGASSTSYDVTERVTTQTRLETALEQLRQAQKMEAVGQLTGGIAHDFNNLLTIIIGSVDAARRRLDAGADNRVRHSLDHAMKGAERAAALTQRLLAFSRQQPLDPKAVEIPRLLTGMADLLKRTIPEAVTIAIEAADDVWAAEADANQLENAILNLAVNARDAMPQGGKLTIGARNHTLHARAGELGPVDYVAISVSDTGVGIGADALAKVFDPFFTTKEVGKGTGLGLSMVYGFARQSGGSVDIVSREGAGTTVTIFLARSAKADPEPIPERGGDHTVFGSYGETILVVEDDEDVRSHTVGSLRELGYRVIEAHDGPSALVIVQRQEQSIHLLLTDVVMPQMSGTELGEAVRKIRPQLPILYTSGYTREAMMRDGRLEPGVELLSKPFTLTTLSTKVRALLDRSSVPRNSFFANN